MTVVRTTVCVAVLAAGVSVAAADTLDVVISGTVGTTDLSRGPFADAGTGDAVSITFQIDTSTDIGFGDFHRYNVSNYQVTIGGDSLGASVDPTFGFTTFSTFAGLDMASTGLLLPGGGTTHNYRIPIFGASGPASIWAPEGSTPDDHLGTFGAALFDTFNDNAIVDSGAGGLGIDQQLDINFTSIQILPAPSGVSLLALAGIAALRRRR